MKNYPTKIITHTAVSAKTHTVHNVDDWHKARWPGFVSRAGWHVGYHYVIEWNGGWTQTREHDEEGAHCIGQNTSSIGVCFMGNGDTHLPSGEQIEAWKAIYQRIHKEFPDITANDIYPHRRYANKTCHGALLSDDYYAKHLPPSPYDKNAAKELIRTLSQLVNRLQSLLLKRRMR